MKDITKKYSKDDITVVWKPSMCIHSGICFNGLPGVFDPRSRPWITPEGATSDEIIKQIESCPSGALSYYKNNEVKSVPINITGESIVEVVPNGPLMVYGNLKVKSLSGEEQSKNKVTAFCRCGGSSNKPYCDGTHRKNNFQG